jgi:hypothetical protein
VNIESKLTDADVHKLKSIAPIHLSGEQWNQFRESGTEAILAVAEDYQDACRHETALACLIRPTAPAGPIVLEDVLVKSRINQAIDGRRQEVSASSVSDDRCRWRWLCRVVHGNHPVPPSEKARLLPYGSE